MWHMNLKYIKRQSIWKHIQLTHCCYMNNYQYCNLQHITYV